MNFFLENTVQGCCSLPLLRGTSENLNRTCQYFMRQKAYHIPSKGFAHLIVPSWVALTQIQQLVYPFLSIIDGTAHHHNVCSGFFYQTSSRVGDFHFFSTQFLLWFFEMSSRIRLIWHVRFVNRKLDYVRYQTSVFGTQLDKYWGQWAMYFTSVVLTQIKMYLIWQYILHIEHLHAEHLSYRLYFQWPNNSSSVLRLLGVVWTISRLHFFVVVIGIGISFLFSLRFRTPYRAS